MSLWCHFECVWIGKDSAADHDAVDTIFFYELFSVLTVTNITVNGEECVWRYLVAEFFDLWNHLKVSVYLAHFFARAKVHGQVDDILFEKMCKPVFPFVGGTVA
ncbi:hypothetical protein D9M69_464800 [compost metagenome]